MSAPRTVQSRSCRQRTVGLQCEANEFTLRQIAFADPVGVERLAASFVGSLVSMSTEVVSLSLQQVGGQAGSAVAVEVGQCRREGRDRDTHLYGGRDDSTPRRLSFLDGLGNALGYSVILLVVGILRELFGSGSLFGVPMFALAAEGGWYAPNGLMLLPPSAFFIIGFFIWALRSWKSDQVEEE